MFNFLAILGLKRRREDFRDRLQSILGLCASEIANAERHCREASQALRQTTATLSTEQQMVVSGIGERLKQLEERLAEKAIAIEVIRNELERL